MIGFASLLLPVPVLLPLGVACLVLVVAHWLPSRAANVAAIATSLVVAALCIWLARASLEGPVLHWFGGWTPESAHRAHVVLGISFAATPLNCAVAAFCALVFAASFTFAWGYFDEIHSHFQILMLFFMAALVGFCLTHDLFNLFVWFELMSVAAFAATAYPLGGSSLEGAFNFIVTNALASFLMLAGVGLLYARTGTLDFTLMGSLVSKSGPDPVLVGGYTLVAVALLTKGAILPFHLWLADAHAVAPSPVSMIFSGCMVGVALVALARVTMEVFAQDPQVMKLVHALLPSLGVATAVVGGIMAWAQRHLKRLLAFSTIAHMGVMVVVLGTASASALEHLSIYLVGHGLVKATLFMVAGILLSLRASADEIVLYRQGRDLPWVGLVMGTAGLLLGGLPLGLLHEASEAILDTVAPLPAAVLLAASALTGAAVLRAGARIFLGWSGAPGVEITAPTEREREKRKRPLWVMLLPCIVLLGLDLALPAFAESPHSGSSHWLEEMAPLGVMAVVLIASLCRRRATSQSGRKIDGAEKLPVRALQFIHSGMVGDYVTWMFAGLAAMVAVVALAR